MSKQNVLITGATAGIGRHLALTLAAKGHRVFATGRKQAALDSLVEQAKEWKLDLEAIQLDVCDASSIDVASRIARERTGGHGIDVLINNAGYGQAGALLELSDAALREQFEVNVFGLMAVTRAFVPEMVERKGGTVINVSNTGGRFTFPFMGAYHASKYAVEALSDALRMELAPFGVRVAIIEPGPVESSFADRTMTSLPSAERSKYREAYARADALRGMSDRFAVGPQQVALAVEHAIESSRPRARYLVPACRFQLLLMLLALLPTRIIDALFRRAAGLSLATTSR